MSDVFDGLEPRQLWEIFRHICAIPHGSKNEAALATYIEKIAMAHGCRVRRDNAGNICIYVKATAGCEHAPPIVLQAHLDMVCEKNETTNHDFLHDGIRCIRKGEWLTADGTTLGADNGIGVAAALALALSDQVRHGPIEILLTVDEETGLTGAMGLDGDLFSGTMLINLDAENSSGVCIGCSGGGGVISQIPINRERPKRGLVWHQLMLSGLRGGHSGMNIHEHRANALKVMAHLLSSIALSYPLYLADLHGGDKHNAIPREARAYIGIEQRDILMIQKCIDTVFDRFKKEYPDETFLEITLQRDCEPQTCLMQISMQKLIDLVLAFPHGVLGISRVMPGCVETSNNLSSIHINEDECIIHNTPRSSCELQLESVIEQICAITKLASGRAICEPTYPGWEPHPDSRLLRIYEDIYEKIYCERPIREVIHAGLECGIIGKKKEGMDMISIGPDIQNCHSPYETVFIPSVQKFWKLLCAMVERIGTEVN
ncbi:MAG: beta-Ala-His dipeptidase [Desulfobacterota bacterium]|nr:beta-Ala-His dipeptidase [Thermodesulfobacteriota bacterium]